MSFLKKLFNISNKKSKEEAKQENVNLSLDDSFVHHFIEKGGKFLYSTKEEEVVLNLKKILLENNWKSLICKEQRLQLFLKDVDVATKPDLNTTIPVFTNCEHLIADSGNILFSSNQLKSKKLSDLSDHFIVFATTSQLVKNISEGLTGIKTNYKKNIPTNICAIKNFSTEKSDDSFLNYGNTNSKNLYLLLLEDL